MFSNVNVDSAPHPPWRKLHPEFYAAASTEQATQAETSDLDEEGELPMFSLNGSIENLGLNNVVTSAIDSRPIIRIGPRASVQRLNVDLNIHDPQLRAVPVELMGHVERLRLRLSWKGTAPIKYEGGKIEHLETGGGSR
jgi:hypothetical protein